jgi:hypothetical protein
LARDAAHAIGPDAWADGTAKYDGACASRTNRQDMNGRVGIMNRRIELPQQRDRMIQIIEKLGPMRQKEPGWRSQ